MPNFRNLILISIDSLRLEALGCAPRRFGALETFPYAVRTPALDRLARDSALFTRLIVQAPFTPTSHASFLTGVNPPGHGLRGFIGYRLSDRVETLAERMRLHGYRTGAVIGADALNSRYGLRRGFEMYDEHFEWKVGIKIDTRLAGQYRRVGQEVTERAIRWLGEQEGPFFLFAHYFDVHHISPQALAESDALARFLQYLSKRARKGGLPRRALARLNRWYGLWRRNGKPFHVRQASRMDTEVGRLIQWLKENNQYENTLIVVISDHGESFGEHGEYGHRRFLYDTTLCAPLLLKGTPTDAGKIIAAPVRSIDLLPTLYELLGLPPRASEGRMPLEGQSLAPLLRGEEREIPAAYSETRIEQGGAVFGGLRSCYCSLRTARWKLIVNTLDGSRALYDLHADSHETRNVAERQRDVTEELYNLLMPIFHSGDGAAPPPPDFLPGEREELERRLQELGYL